MPVCIHYWPHHIAPVGLPAVLVQPIVDSTR